MAAPCQRVLRLGFKIKCSSIMQISQRNMGFINDLRTRVFGGSKTEVAQVIEVKEPELEKEDEFTLKRKTIEPLRPYSPPTDVEQRIQKNMDLIIGPMEQWKNFEFKSRFQKYELLTAFIEEFDHDIPNVTLHEMSNIQDVIDFYKTEVRDTSVYVDMAKLDLPKNVHINLEPVRFDKDNDPAYGGKSAFPESKTIVSSVKYRRKYKGDDDTTHPVRDRPQGLARWKN